MKFEKKLNNRKHDEHITTPEFNILTADLVKKQTLMLNCQTLTEKLLQMKQNTYLLKIKNI